MMLDKYAGEWNYFKASHLLRRTIYGASNQQIKQVIELGMESTIDKIIADVALPSPPINHNYQNDPFVPTGETWVNAGYKRIQGLAGYRRLSLNMWMVEQMMESRLNITEKMILFWHNHFVTAGVNDARFRYQYIDTIRRNALGNFRTLTKAMTIDPSMLRYLNGNQNTKNAPNENYARELLELFTVGKGPIAGPGDYTTFTETDVVEIAKILTGWRDFGHHNVQNPGFGSRYVTNRHDRSTKKLSHRFNEVEVYNLEEDEYSHLIDIVFTSRSCAEHLSRKLYVYFVHHDVNDEIEEKVIQPMADIMVDADYEIKPVLRALLASEAFYSEDVIGCSIKNPLEFITDAANIFPIIIEDNSNAHLRVYRAIFDASQSLQMELFNPPSVAGWKAYYQGPGFSKIWINSNTLPIRKAIIDAVTIAGLITDRAAEIQIDVLTAVDNLGNPYDINDMLEELSLTLFPYPLPDTVFATLKELLIPGLPDFEWTVEYAAYRDNPGDETARRVVQGKILLLFNYMMNLPEFQLA